MKKRKYQKEKKFKMYKYKKEKFLLAKLVVLKNNFFLE